MLFKSNKRRAKIINQEIINSKPDPVAEIIRIKRPNKRIGLLAKFFWGIFFILLLYGGIVGARTLLAYREINVENLGNSSPFLRLPRVTPEVLAGEGDGRINLLIIGVGGAGHPGGTLADTIMVASIDPKNNKVALLSIPRDLYVTYPKPFNTIKDKINSVHSFGEQTANKVTGGGPELLKKEVAQILDLPIHYFIRVDFDGFKKIVDELGGVTVNVEKPINDLNYPATNMIDFDPFRITAGIHNLDGSIALKYARSRESTSDFDRAKRQQLIITAIKDKSLTVGVLANPKKVLDIIGILGKHIRTDLNSKEIERLIKLFINIPSNSFTTKVLDNGPDGPLTNYNNGGYYLVPRTGDFKEIQQIAHGLFTDPLIEQENASIDIVNASGIPGKGQEVAILLKSYNYKINQVFSASTTIKKTIISSNNNSSPLTLDLIKKRLTAPLSSTLPEEISKIATPADIVVIIGEDYHGGKKTD